MKNILISIALVAFVLVPSYAVGGHNGTYAIEVTGTPDTITPDVTVGAGCAYVENTLEVDGATRFDGAVTFNGAIVSSDSFVNIVYPLTDLAASDGNIYVSSTGASVGSFGVDRSTNISLLQAGGTTWTLAKADYTDAIHARNISAVMRSTSTASDAILESSATLTILGYTARGELESDTISMIDHTVRYSNKAFLSVVSFTVSDATATWSSVGYAARKVGFEIGTSNKIGLPIDIDTTADIFKVIVAGATESSSDYTANRLYNTIDFLSDGNAARDYEVYIKVKQR